ncbi:MAG: hypothetical protein LUD69_07840 [Oscillospiraceae bacterium]|nr:hypothetical protein [Oscillospiraceae bacterium]
MSVELRENEWAERMISLGELGRKPGVTVRRVARYYLDCGYDRRAAERAVEEFVLRCAPDSGSLYRSSLAENGVKWAMKQEAVNIDWIGVSAGELEKIGQISRRPVKRLAFTLLCLAKYGMIRNPKSNYWVSTPCNDIMRMANIKTSTKRQDAMFQELNSMGLIEFSVRVDNLSVRVCFVDDGEPVLQVPDFRNLGYRYQMYLGEPYFECVNCGLVTPQNDPKNQRRQKYCPDCALKIRTKQHVEAVSRYDAAKRKRKQEVQPAP